MKNQYVPLPNKICNSEALEFFMSPGILWDYALPDSTHRPKVSSFGRGTAGIYGSAAGQNHVFWALQNVR